MCNNCIIIFNICPLLPPCQVLLFAQISFHFAFGFPSGSSYIYFMGCLSCVHNFFNMQIIGVLKSYWRKIDNF